MLRDEEKILPHQEKTMGALYLTTDDNKTRKKKNVQNKPMNLCSSFRNANRQGKKTGVFSQITTDYKSRKRKIDKTMNVAFTFRSPARPGKNNGCVIFETADYKSRK